MPYTINAAEIYTHVEKHFWSAWIGFGLIDSCFIHKSESNFMYATSIALRQNPVYILHGYLLVRHVWPIMPTDISSTNSAIEKQLIPPKTVVILTHWSSDKLGTVFQTFQIDFLEKTCLAAGYLITIPWLFERKICHFLIIHSRLCSPIYA